MTRIDLTLAGLKARHGPDLRLLIRANRKPETIAQPRVTLKDVHVLIDAEVLDSVTLTDRSHVMLLDDNGHNRERPVNALATALYHACCHPGTTHPIRGDVVIAPDEDFG